MKRAPMRSLHCFHHSESSFSGPQNRYFMCLFFRGSRVVVRPNHVGHATQAIFLPWRDRDAIEVPNTNTKSQSQRPWSIVDVKGQLQAMSIPFTIYFLAPCRFLACIGFIHQLDLTCPFSTKLQSTNESTHPPRRQPSVELPTTTQDDSRQRKNKGTPALHVNQPRHPISSPPTGPVFLDGSSVSHMKPSSSSPF